MERRGLCRLDHLSECHARIACHAAFKPSIPFPWVWCAFELGEARHCDTLYGAFPYEGLPPIPELDWTLSWLGQPGWQEAPDDSPERRASRQRATTEARGEVCALVVQADHLGLRLPPAFTRLMSAPEMYTRIPEYAGCWFNLYEARRDHGSRLLLQRSTHDFVGIAGVEKGRNYAWAQSGAAD